MLAVVGANGASASTTFTYTPGAASDTVQGFSFTTSLDGAAIANLATNTDITGTIAPFTFAFDTTTFGPDQLGFPIGGPFGSSYYNTLGNATVTVGTDALGQITTWNIFQTVFVSWPAFPGEDPNDFFGTYSLATTNGGNTVTLTQDHNAGLAPTYTGRGVGSFSATSAPAVPEPATWAMMLIGFGAIGLMMRYRRRQTVRFNFA